MGREEIVNLINERIRQKSPEFCMQDYKLQALPNEARQKEHGWDVPIHPDRQPEYNFRYYELLATVEQELEEQLGTDIMILPSGVTQ